MRGPCVVEVGIGTGKNLPYYPPGLAMTAIDLAPRMLARARDQASRLGVVVDLREANTQALPFPDARFDTVVATLVFCSAPNAVLAVRRELSRCDRCASSSSGWGWR